MLNWHDKERNEGEIARLSPGDVGGHRRYEEFMSRASAILYRYFFQDPPTLAQVAEDVRGTADEAVWWRMLTGNMRDLVEEHFESPEVRAAFIDAEDAQDPRAPGSIMSMAYIHADKFTEPHNLGIPHGGMGGITQAMARAAESLGVEIRTSSPVRQNPRARWSRGGNSARRRRGHRIGRGAIERRPEAHFPVDD